jgi:hypothetical protein
MTIKKRVNHYKYLEKHLGLFWLKARGKTLEEYGLSDAIVAHGDKTDQYADDWEEHGISHSHGAAILI